MATHISLFGGPASGKSTSAAGLFHELKKRHIECELVTEYAKDLVYSKDFMTLSDQLMVLAKQHHHWFKLDDQLEYTVSDAPFLHSCIYLQEKDGFPAELFKKFVVELYKSYDTINIFLEREESYYQEYGRLQNLEECLEIDSQIKSLLDENNIPYYSVKINENTIQNILDLLKFK